MSRDPMWGQRTTVEAVIRGYRVRQCTASERAAVTPIIQEIASRAFTESVSTTRDGLTALGRFFLWALREGYEPSVGLLRPELVEYYYLEGTSGLTVATRASYRSTLRRASQMVNPGLQDVDLRPHVAGRRAVHPPYSRAEIAEYRRAASQQATAHRRRVFEAVLALGTGAGLRSSEIVATAGPHIRQDAGLTLIDVPGKHSRTVPVAISWASTVLDLAARFSDTTLIGGNGRQELHALTAKLEHPATVPALRASRLRTSWLVALLAAGLTPAELMLLGGFESPDVVRSLAQYIPARDTEYVRRLAAGAAL